MPDGERRLAAIMFTDIVGFTSLTQKNEALAMSLLEEHRRLLSPFFPKHNGREVKTVGDAFLVEFPSALEALRCAHDIQSSMHEWNSRRPDDRRILLRIGIHLGDVIHSQNDIYGDAVNIASRIQSVAGPEGICISQQVYDQVRNKSELPLVPLAKRFLKNVSGPTQLYKVAMPWKEEEAPPAVPEGAPRSQRIAILPFANLSPDSGDEYFADGMTEEVISTLSKVRDFEVISRTSIMQYKKNPKPILEVSRELNAGTVLEGSVRKAGDRLRITVQVIDATKDKHLWAESYDRDFQDVFAIQGDIAVRVAEALRIRIPPADKAVLTKKATSSTEAYTLYLKGRHFWNRRGLDDIRKAAECFEMAVKEDPEFALGYVGQADCCLVLRSNWNENLVANLQKAKAMIAKALELDLELAEVHATKGSSLRSEYDLRNAEEEYRIATELKPSYAYAHMWYYTLLMLQLRLDEALEEIEKAMELDPLSPVITWNYGYYYHVKKDYSKALGFFKRAIELGYAAAHSWTAVAYGQMKMFDEMKRELTAYAELVRGEYPLVDALVEISAAVYREDWPTLRRLLPEAEAHMQETGCDAYGIANCYFSLGEIDKGFEWLEQSYSRREDSLQYIRVDRELDTDENSVRVRNDSRYLNLLKKVGLD